MKTIDLFCASPASTAICSSTDKHGAIVRHGLRPMEQYRRNTHHFYDKPKVRTPIIPCSPQQQPITPKPYYDCYKSRKSSNSPKKIELLRRKSSADIDDLYSPPGSSRYLLSRHNPFVDFSSEESESSYGSSTFVHSPKRLTSSNDHHSRALTKSFSTRPASSSQESPVFSSSSNSSSRSRAIESPIVKSNSRSRPRHQVVELWVSIHCKGCEGKVRKHISRMEGVKSFSIDLATKKVTIIGDVTPLSVLSSISKVKSAQFWPSPTSSSSSSSSSLPVFRQRY